MAKVTIATIRPNVVIELIVTVEEKSAKLATPDGEPFSKIDRTYIVAGLNYCVVRPDRICSASVAACRK